MVFSFLEEVYQSPAAQPVNNAWGVYLLVRGRNFLFLFSIGLVLSLACELFSFPLSFFEHLSRMLIHLPLPVRGIFQARCFAHFWVWFDTRVFILNCRWERWNTAVVLSSTQGADVPQWQSLLGNRGGWRPSNQWKRIRGPWERAVATGTTTTRITDLLPVPFWPRDQCMLQTVLCIQKSGWLTCCGRSTYVPACGICPFSFRWQS